jgi:hypothetical protein
MIAPSDPEYKSTKLIKQGKANMDSDFKPLAKWIDGTYDVKTINIVYDTIDNGIRPRLQIIFESSQEAEKFRTKYGFDKVRQQEIATEFEKSLIKQRLLTKKSIWNFFTTNTLSKYKTENILVVFGAFEPVAKVEVSWSISKDEIERLQTDLNIDDIWKIYPEMFNSPTFFFYTDKQVEEYSKSGMKAFLAEKYFNLLKSFDEFNYIIKEQFEIKLDSKENFDSTYKGSWFNYDKR